MNYYSNRTITGKFAIKLVDRIISINTELVNTSFSGDGYCCWDYVASINTPVTTVLLVKGILDYKSNANNNTSDETMTISNGKDGSWSNEENYPYGDSDVQGAYTSEYHWSHYTLTIDGTIVENNGLFGINGLEHYTGSKEYIVGNFRYTVTFYSN